MKSPKFDEQDRSKVISEIEEYFNTRLSRVGSRRKYLKDENGKSYWVFGGYEDWHGIPQDMFEEETRRATEGVLVVAKRFRNRIDIYSGPLQPIIDSRDTLSHTQTGDYQFNIYIRSNHLFIKEVAGLSLAKLGETPYSEGEKESDTNIGELKKIISKLSAKEREELLKEYSDKK